MAAAFPTHYALAEYQNSHRRVVEQPLNIGQSQSRRLVALVNENLKPQNATYRYNYIYDNCATRPLSLIEKAVGDSIQFAPAAVGPEDDGQTFRSLMRRYHRNYPWYQFGIDLALGTGIDAPVSSRESCFAPVGLRDSLPEARFARMQLPVIGSASAVLVAGPAEGIMAPPTPWLLSPETVCWTVAVVVVMSLMLSWKRGRRARKLVSCIFGVNCLVGLLLTFLIFISVHEATSPNWLYLWLNPFCVFGVWGVWLKKRNALLVCYHFANFVAIMTLAGIGVAEIQHLNSAFYPLMLPAALISLHYLYLYRQDTEKPTESKRLTSSQQQA